MKKTNCSHMDKYLPSHARNCSQTKTTHTPGPWTFEHSMEEDGYVVFPEKEIDPSGRPIALLTGFKNGEDARLIAAAPELLAACKRALDYSNMEGNDIAFISKAVSKAEGK